MSEKCDAKEKTEDKTSFLYGQPFILFLPLVRNSGLLASNLQKPRRGTLHTRSWLLELINSFMKRHAPLPAYRFACLTHFFRLSTLSLRCVTVNSVLAYSWAEFDSSYLIPSDVGHPSGPHA
jgi:hypothetical protein